MLLGRGRMRIRVFEWIDFHALGIGELYHIAHIRELKCCKNHCTGGYITLGRMTALQWEAYFAMGWIESLILKETVRHLDWVNDR